MILFICVICGWIWLLLCYAMDGSHAPDQWLAVDGNYSAILKELLQGLDRADVIRVTKHGKKHDVVGDVEICVTGRQSIEFSSAGARAADNTWHW